jgi:hypothetical protein
MRGGQPAGRQNQQARPAPPPGGWRGIGGDIGREARLAQPDVAPRPPAEIPPPAPPVTARPPQEAPPAAARPPADRPLGPNEYDVPVTAPRAGQLDPVMMARTIEAIQKEALRGINPNTSKEQAMAQGAKGRAALIAAGVPPAMARAAMLDTGAKTAVLMGYGPGGKNSTVLGFPIPQSTIQGKITEGVGEAMQGYNPATSGGVIGKSNAFGGPVQGPPSPASLGKQGSLLDFLQNFNPISTAEARGRGRGESYPVPPGSTRSNPHFTFYGPGPGGRMEGGFETSRPNQAGTNVPITLDMVRSAREQGRDLNVTLASDPSRYGETINVGTVTFVSPIDGKQYTLDNVRGFVHDTGSAFKGRPEKVDIAVSDYTGWSERAAGDQTALAHIGAAPNAIVVAGPGEIGATAVGALPPAPPPPMRGLAKGGHVAENEPVVVGEEGPEYFVPDQPGTVWPHIPQPGKGGKIDRWPKIPAPEYPGRYGGVEREILRQTRDAQDPSPGLMDMIDSGRLRLNEANWRRMIGDPDLIALGRSRIEDRR